MGMAAGQARLLSITTRMSDNELRAQIINNDKMRLATESSRVSENYVAALNETQLMFKNYDSENNASFKNLTFNALTSYNPYNNQYGLVNSSGNILVSENDADNFRRAGGDINRFLKAYGLEYTTTYFDNLLGQNGEPVGYNSSSQVYYSIGNEDDYGNILIDQSSGFSPAQLEKMYRGMGKTNMKGKEIENKGYDQIHQEGYYNDYLDLLDIYNTKYDNYLNFISAAMDEEFGKVVAESFKDINGSINSVDALQSKIQSTNSVEDMSKLMQQIKNLLNQTRTSHKSSENYDDANTYYNDLSEYLDQFSSPTVTRTYKYSDDEFTVLTDGNGTYYIGYKNADGSIDDIEFACKEHQLYDIDDNGSLSKSEALSFQETGFDCTKLQKDENGETFDLGGQTLYECKDIPNGATFSVTTKNTLEAMKEAASSVVQSLKESIYHFWDPMDKAWQTTEAAKDAYNEFKKAAQELGKFMYGDSYNENPPYEKLGDASYCYNNNGGSFTENMSSVFQVLLLDAIMNTYGEPHYTWIDTSSRTDSYNENGEAKAQWYQNLFERMSKGFSVILDGLASSTEWIQFAFENGLVTLEQVDGNNAWNSLGYTNCSDITEETKDAMVTKAEAEYKTAMNKIENKDKRYDMELKNIDTEHNSLQTEYESIKSAIDKNVERTFKMYSA